MRAVEEGVMDRVVGPLRPDSMDFLLFCFGEPPSLSLSFLPVCWVVAMGYWLASV
jgi:hypothetical protein